MKATLNSRPVEVPADCDTFSQVLDYIESERLPAGHVITSIVVDGREIEGDEAALLARPCRDIREVEITTARALQLAREGLAEALGMLPQLSDALRESAQLLKVGQAEAGLDLLYECLGQIEWYLGLIAALDVYFTHLVPSFDDADGLGGFDAGLSGGLGHDGLDADGPELRTFASVENLRGRLIEVQRLQREDRLAELADAVEHELVPIARLWQREAPLLLRRVEREGAMA